VIVAGMDEAGYGPKLGPLTVGWTAFDIGGNHKPTLGPRAELPCLWEKLEAVTRRGCDGDPSKLWVADSKEIKPRKDGLKQLELGLLAFVATHPLYRAAAPATVAHLLEALGQPAAHYAAIRWYGDLTSVRVPAYSWSGEVAARALRVTEACGRSKVAFAGAGVRVLDEGVFNQRCLVRQNKAAVLGDAFIDLVRQLRASFVGPIDLVCDKQGGRSMYVDMLKTAFPGCAIEVDYEEPELSRYRVAIPAGQLRVTFRPEAERTSFCVALASMMCKYLREVFMDRLNGWFARHVPGVEPTAGYGSDATRFIVDVQGALPRLGVPLETLVRSR
jgi:ribonuclease HII